MLSLILSIISGGLILYLITKWLTKDHQHFAKMGLKNITPVYPLVGNNGHVFWGKQGAHEKLLEWYNAFPNEKIVGIFDMMMPVFFIRDCEILKRLTIKDFADFQDHRFFTKEGDGLFGSALIAMQGKDWRDMRSTLSPLFTGRKMRIMLDLINHCAKQFSDYIKKNENKVFVAKDIFSKYTTDIIGSCAFGVECNSLENEENEFYQIGLEIQKFTRLNAFFKFLFIRFFPRLARLLRIEFFSKRAEKLFQESIIETMKIRKERNIQRPDIVQLLMSLKEGNFANVNEEDNKELLQERELIKGEIKKNWTDTELIAQSFIFFFAGYDTTSTALQFLFYELALNQEVQEKLYQEILETLENTKYDKISYEEIKGMKFMNMVINEALRKWPPFIGVDRLCVSDYVYNDEDNSGLSFSVKKDEAMIIPIYSFHMDPKNFPNPEKFDPERFSEEGRNENNLDAFIPFGIGPRNCIGLRFALLQIKALLFHVLKDFKIIFGDDMEVPLKLKRIFFGLSPEKDILIQFKTRANKGIHVHK